MRMMMEADGGCSPDDGATAMMRWPGLSFAAFRPELLQGDPKGRVIPDAVTQFLGALRGGQHGWLPFGTP